MMYKKGFTLIEMILVVVIIALLAALILPQIAGKSEKARQAAAKAQISAIKSALQNFEIECYRYPTTAEGLQALIEKPSGLSENAKWTKPFLSEKVVPLDPWGNPYIYRSPGSFNPETFDLLSAGPDGEEGTDDDIR